MKVYISKYRDHWLSPYTILEKVFFWREIDYDEPLIERLSKLLLPFSTALQKVLDTIHPRVTYVKIDKWDTWSMDYMLAHIVVPMLKQLKETKHGAPSVDDKDVPVHLRSTSAEPKENEWDTDSNHFMRWDYVLDEMIWTFEQIADENNDDQFHTGNWDMKSVPVQYDGDGKPSLYTFEEGPLHTHKFDEKAYQLHQKRIDNGMRLFGKYYRSLWD